MAYASSSDLVDRYDVRRLGQLVNDDGTQATPSALSSSSKVTTALDDASGMIDAASLAGGRYAPADLTGLTGQDLAFLKRLTCDLAYGYLVARRGFTGADFETQAPGFKLALDILKQLREGGLIFNVQSAIDAGKPVRAVIDKNLQLISSTTRLFGDLIVNPSNPGNPTQF